MKPIKLFRSISINDVVVKAPSTSSNGLIEVIQVEGWAYKSRTSDGRYVIDSDYENIDTDNIELIRFHQGTMPLLFNHDQTQIVGKIIGVRKEYEGLKITADIYNFSDDALSSYIVPRVKSGLISAFSIGVLVKDFDLIEQDGDEYLQIKESEAFEVSLVSVPANSSALFNVVSETSKGLTVGITKSALKVDNPSICSDLAKCGLTTTLKAIDNTKISTNAWSDVDKTALAHKVQDLGIKYIKEAYLYVGDPDKVSTYKLPHHEVIGGDLVVNKNGVQAAYASLQGARGNKPDLSSDELLTAKRHLLKHYKEMLAQGMIEEIPEELKTLAEEETTLKGNNVQTKSIKGATKAETVSDTTSSKTEEDIVEKPDVAENTDQSEENGKEEVEQPPVENGGTSNTSDEHTTSPEEKDNKEEAVSEKSDEKSEESTEESDDTEEREAESDEESDHVVTLESSLSVLEAINVDELDEDQLEAVYEIVATLSEKIEAKVVEQLKETLQEVEKEELSA